MQDTQRMPIGERGEDQVDGRQPVVPGASELSLGVERSPFDLLVDRDQWERQQLRCQRRMVIGGAGRIAGLKQEGKLTARRPDS